MMVTMPSGAMRIKAFSAAGSPLASGAAAMAARATGGKVACSNKPPPTATVARKNARRECAAADGNWERRDLMEDLAVNMIVHHHLTGSAPAGASAACLIAARMRV